MEGDFPFMCSLRRIVQLLCDVCGRTDCFLHVSSSVEANTAWNSIWCVVEVRINWLFLIIAVLLIRPPTPHLGVCWLGVKYRWRLYSQSTVYRPVAFEFIVSTACTVCSDFICRFIFYAFTVVLDTPTIWDIMIIFCIGVHKKPVWGWVSFVYSNPLFQNWMWCISSAPA